METNETSCVSLGLELYSKFFETLMTALKNSMKNFDNACWNTSFYDMRGAAYYGGKYDAFAEIANRLLMEYNIVYQSVAGKKDVEALESIRWRKAQDLDKMFGDQRFCGRHHELMRFERALSQLLESYASEGFMVGKALAEHGEVESPFNPEDFANLCRENLIPSDYLQNILIDKKNENKHV